jgi:hypothetical protein
MRSELEVDAALGSVPHRDEVFGGFRDEQHVVQPEDGAVGVQQYLSDGCGLADAAIAEGDSDRLVQRPRVEQDALVGCQVP